MNGVVLDLAQHPDPCWAVVRNGQLLPVRFGKELEAVTHLGQLIDAANRPKAQAPEAA